jgi:hypothetical protein
VLEALSATAPETQLLQEIDKAELPKLGKLPVNTQLATYCKIWKDRCFIYFAFLRSGGHGTCQFQKYLRM